MTTPPSFFHNQNNTIFPKVFNTFCSNSQLPIPRQPTTPEPTFFDNLINSNKTTICTKSQHTLGLVRPM